MNKDILESIAQAVSEWLGVPVPIENEELILAIYDRLSDAQATQRAYGRIQQDLEQVIFGIALAQLPASKISRPAKLSKAANEATNDRN